MIARNYPAAIAIYEDILAKDNVTEAKIDLAEAYRQMNDYEKAEYWYSQVVHLAGARPIHALNYATLLRLNGKCRQAKKWYRKFANAYPDDKRRKFFLDPCTQEDRIRTKNEGIFNIKHLDFNSPFDDLAPVFYRNGIVFVSERTKEDVMVFSDKIGKESFLDLFYTEISTLEGDLVFSVPVRFSKKINSPLHETSACFSEDNAEIFFTRNRVDGKGWKYKNQLQLEIVHAKNYGLGDWEEQESLGFNSPEYSVAHPALSPDGKRLYFSSDMPGGYGGKDIYVSYNLNGIWGPPVNLGPVINTEGDEMWPFMSRGGTLYFASNGHFGLGGLDIFTSRELEPRTWKTVDNIGYPFNTTADDYGLVIDWEGQYGFFTSSREGSAGGSDVFTFKKRGVRVKVQIQEAETEFALRNLNVQRACRKDTFVTDKKGFIEFDMAPDECCKLVSKIPGYDTKVFNVCTHGFNSRDTVKKIVVLQPEPTFGIRGVVFDASNGLPIRGALVKLASENCSTPEAVVTDASGQYSFSLSRNCCYQVQAEKGNFYTELADKITCTNIATSEMMYSQNIFLERFEEGKVREKSTLDLDPELNPNEVEHMGKKVKEEKDTIQLTDFKLVEYEDKETPYYLLNIPFQKNKKEFQQEATKDLNKLFQYLASHPELTIEIGTHTDSRGKEKYNQSLSQERAQNIVSWLVGKGIQAKRLAARGYGESNLLQACGEDPPCSEAIHQANRRTEFKILGEVK